MPPPVDEDTLGEHGPEGVVCRGVAGGGDDGGHLEGRIAECLQDRAVQVAGVGGNSRDSAADDHQVGSQLLVCEDRPESPEGQEKVQIEIDAEQDHKHSDDSVQVGTVKMSHTVRIVGESAGARCAEGVEQRVKKIHAPQHQKNDEDHR